MASESCEPMNSTMSLQMACIKESTAVRRNMIVRKGDGFFLPIVACLADLDLVIERAVHAGLDKVD
jgi:hypothetical protein